MNLRCRAAVLFCIVLLSTSVIGFVVGESVDLNETSPEDEYYCSGNVSSYHNDLYISQTVVIDIDPDNRFAYGEKGLIVTDTFDPASIPQTYDRAAAREALGYDLYMSNNSIHEEIIQGYQARYPELSLPYGDIQYVYHYGNRLTMEFRPDGTLGMGTFSVEYVETPPESSDLPYVFPNLSKKSVPPENLRSFWKNLMSRIHGEDFDIYHISNSSNRGIAHSL